MAIALCCGCECVCSGICVCQFMYTFVWKTCMSSKASVNAVSCYMVLCSTLLTVKGKLLPFCYYVLPNHIFISFVIHKAIICKGHQRCRKKLIGIIQIKNYCCKRLVWLSGTMGKIYAIVHWSEESTWKKCELNVNHSKIKWKLFVYCNRRVSF